MWPWESAAFAYLCYSSLSHVRYRDAPSGLAVVVAGVASILPDVVDKPLHWQYGIFTSGYALGHSIFVSVALLAVAVVAGRRFDRPRLGLAFGVGFLSHNVGDALEHAVSDGVRAGVARVLWPLVSTHSRGEPGFSTAVGRYLRDYLTHLTRLEFTPYFALVGLVGVLTLVLWAYDGYPVLRELLAAARDAGRSRLG